MAAGGRAEATAMAGREGSRSRRKRRRGEQGREEEGEENGEDENAFLALRGSNVQTNAVAAYGPPAMQQRLQGDSTWQEAARIRSLHGIRVEGQNILPPITSFSACVRDDFVLAQLERQGCKEPTPVQMQVLPCVMHGRDMMIQAETGSGKTLAYLLPLLSLLESRSSNQAGGGPLALIVVPTRELVEQVYSQLTLLMPNGNSSASDNPPPYASPTVADVAANSAPSTPFRPAVSGGSVQQTVSQNLIPNSAYIPSQSHMSQPCFQFNQSPSPHHYLGQSAPLPSHGYTSHQYGPFSQPFTDQSLTNYPSNFNQNSIWASQNVSISHTHGMPYQQYPFPPSLSSPYPGHPYVYETHSQTNVVPPQFSPAAPPPSNPNSTFCPQSLTLEHDIEESAAPPSLLDCRKRHKVLGAVGGVPIGGQVRALKAGVDVVVATPGRLLDLLERGVLSLGHVAYLVLDEADRMLGEGMDEQLRQILSRVPEQKRQTVLVSATMPFGLQRLAMSALADPVSVTAGEVGSLTDSVHHEVIFLHTFMKKEKLLQILRKTERPPVIIFCNSVRAVDSLVQVLRNEQFHVAGLHSAKCQPFRFRCMHAMREGKLDVLVATDVASRGIDLTDVTRVVNYELPDSIEDYIHRCGRTGRIGKKGVATSFLTLECTIAKELRQLLQQSCQEVPSELHNLRQFGGRVIKTDLGDMSLSSGKFSTD